MSWVITTIDNLYENDSKLLPNAHLYRTENTGYTSDGDILSDFKFCTVFIEWQQQWMIVNHFKILIIIGVLFRQFSWNHCIADNKWHSSWSGLLKCQMCQLIRVGRWLLMSRNMVIILVIYRRLLSLQTVHFTICVVRKQKVCLFKHRGHFGWTSTIFLLYEITCTCGRGLKGPKFRILTDRARETSGHISKLTVRCVSRTRLTSNGLLF